MNYSSRTLPLPSATMAPSLASSPFSFLLASSSFTSSSTSFPPIIMSSNATMQSIMMDSSSGITPFEEEQQQQNASAASAMVIRQQHQQQQQSEDAEQQETKTCVELDALFSGINHFFRSEDILKQSEHSSILLGNLIFGAYLVVIAFGAFGNLLTITAVVRNKQMRTVRNFFILNLALSDFFVCTVTAPTTLYTVLYVFWPFTRTLCKIAGSLQGFNIFLSTFSITAIALDRYVLVIFPTKRQRQERLSLVFFSLIWLASILLAAPLFLAADFSPIFRDEQCGIKLNLCNEQNERWKEMLLSKEAYTVGVIILQYLLPLAAIAFAYSRIARRMGARKARGGSGMVNSRKDSTEMIVVVAPAPAAATVVVGNVVSARNSQCPPPPPTTTAPVDTQSDLLNNKGHHSHSSFTASTAHNNTKGGGGGGTAAVGQGQGAAKTTTAEALVNQRRKSIADRHRRTNMLLVTLVVVFACAWLPLNIFHLFNTFSNTASFSVPIFAFCHLIAMCSACLNPCCYAFFNNNFRQEFIGMYRCIYRTLCNTAKLVGLRSSSAGSKAAAATATITINNIGDQQQRRGRRAMPPPPPICHTTRTGKNNGRQQHLLNKLDNDDENSSGGYGGNAAVLLLLPLPPDCNDGAKTAGRGTIKMDF